MPDLPFRFYHSIDVLRENLYRPNVIRDFRLEISRPGLLHLIGFEFLNLAIPLMLTKQVLDGLSHILQGLIEQDAMPEKMIAKVVLQFFLSILLLMVANSLYTQDDVSRSKARWLMIFVHVLAWYLSFHMVYHYLLDEHLMLSHLSTSVFWIGMLQRYTEDLSERLRLFLIQLQREQITLALPYHILQKPYLNSISNQLIDTIVMELIWMIKPAQLQIEWNASGQLPNTRPENLSYYGLIHDFKYLKPNLHFNLKHNYLFSYLSRREIDGFIAQVPFDKRDSIDLSENGESDYQRAEHPMRQLVKQSSLNDDVGKEILSYLSNR